MKDFQERTITCVDCGAAFVWTAKGQQFFAEQGFKPPKRCKLRRETRRQEKKA